MPLRYTSEQLRALKPTPQQHLDETLKQHLINLGIFSPSNTSDNSSANEIAKEGRRPQKNTKKPEECKRTETICRNIIF